MIFLNNADFTESLSCDMALAIKPNYADAWNSRGVALVEPGQDASNVSCDKGLAINPDYASACFIRGVKPGIR